MARQVTRQMVMDDIGLANERTDDRSVFAHVGIFQPMDRARDQIGEQQYQQELKQQQDEFRHTPG